MYYAAELQIFLLGADIFDTMGSITQHTDPASRRLPPSQGNSRTEKLCIMGELERERTSNLFFGEEKGKNEM